MISLKINLIDTNDMDLSKSIWLAGCPIKGNFRAKRTINAFFLPTFGFYVCKEASVIQPIIGLRASCETNNKFSGVSLAAFFYRGKSIDDVQF